MSEQSPGTPVAPAEAAPGRLQALDAYRGLIMLTLLTRGLFAPLKEHPNAFWKWLAVQNNHVDWAGCVYWDMIQPSFMFMVGVAMPFAFARRTQLGDSWTKQLFHTLFRAFNLIAIGIILDNIGRDTVQIGFIRVLQQIAPGYVFAFFLLGRSFKTQAAVCAAILVGYNFLWMNNSYNGAGGPWAKGVENIGGAFDRWMVGRNYSGPYVGMNAIPSAVTIVFGLMAGQLIALRGEPKKTAWILLIAGVSGVVLGLGVSPWLPLIKKIWTPSFAVFAAGCTTLALLFFYWSIEIMGWKRWAFPLVVVGCNSMAAYIIGSAFNSFYKGLTNPWVAGLKPEMGDMWFNVFNNALFALCSWGVLYWLYRRKIFFKA
ncbi:MAG: hypothetical protein WCT04_25710 [Planctomycetota bacterium]